MSGIDQAGIHAEQTGHRRNRILEGQGFTPEWSKKTLAQALEESRKGMSKAKRRNLLMITIAKAAGHELGA